jgi:hypothetical protein
MSNASTSDRIGIDDTAACEEGGRGASRAVSGDAPTRRPCA